MTDHRSHLPAAALLAVGLLGAAGAHAQSPGIVRTPVLKADLSTPNHEAVIVRAEVAPGAEVARHTHPGDEVSYILEGEGELLVDGEAPRRVGAGQAFVVPAGKVHGARNPGSVPLRLVATYLVEKGKPVATPAK